MDSRLYHQLVSASVKTAGVCSGKNCNVCSGDKGRQSPLALFCPCEAWLQLREFLLMLSPARMEDQMMQEKCFPMPFYVVILSFFVFYGVFAAFFFHSGTLSEIVLSVVQPLFLLFLCGEMSIGSSYSAILLKSLTSVTSDKMSSVNLMGFP